MSDLRLRRGRLKHFGYSEANHSFDGLGILVGAVIAWLFHLPTGADVALEYALGFAFGWSVFQSLFMRDMAGGYYKHALSSAFFPELLSMNCLMAGMVPVMTLAMKSVPVSHDPSGPAFWFIMSMALLVGFVTAYPMNWWLVSQTPKTRHDNGAIDDRFCKRRSR
ncbi:MAG: DUF4396 domain-containing protein [Bryobacteraceae bacterium]